MATGASFASHERPAVTARICLVTPGHLSTNPRLVKEADALSARGFDVRVVAADYLGWARAADAEFRTRAWRAENPVTFGPLAPMATRLRQALGQRGARLCVARGWGGARAQERAWHPAAPDFMKAVAGVRADLYIAHYPAALAAAAYAARVHGAAYAFDAEDFHLGDIPEDTAFEPARRLTRTIEQRYLPGAAYMSAAAPLIADAYGQAYRIARPTVVLNVFSRADAPPAPTRQGDARPGPSLYWFSQTIGPDRGLECAVLAIARAASAPHLHLLGQCATGFREKLTALAQANACAARLHFHPPEPPSTMARRAAAYDIGLAGETRVTPNRQYALTNKLFTYLLAGVPIIASDTPAQRAFAAAEPECTALYAVDDADALAARLDDWLLSPARLAEARACAFALGQARYNWEVESEILIALVENALARSARTLAAPCASH